MFYFLKLSSDGSTKTISLYQNTNFSYRSVEWYNEQNVAGMKKAHKNVLFTLITSIFQKSSLKVANKPSNVSPCIFFFFFYIMYVAISILCPVIVMFIFFIKYMYFFLFKKNLFLNRITRITKRYYY